MKAADLTMLIEQVDLERLGQLRQHRTKEDMTTTTIAHVEAAGQTGEASASLNSEENEQLTYKLSGSANSNKIVGKIQKLGDMVDTNASRPGMSCNFVC
jgi:hypothetical protein